MQAASFGIESTNGHGAARTLRLSGDLALDDGRRLWEELRQRVPDSVRQLEIDLSATRSVEGSIAALLLELRAELRQRGGEVEFTGADERTRHLLELYGCPGDHVCGRAPPQSIGTLDHVGRATVDVGKGLLGIFAFVGDMTSSVRAALRRPRTVNWRDIARLMEQAGANGAPIVLLINFLVGLIIALQAAEQLQRFGADVFVADLVGLSITRELAPLMTAIVVAGRSGASFAAELGTMKVSEEVDALRTLGLDPQRHLVFPRVLAMALVVPILTLGGDVVGCLGGLAIAIGVLELPAEIYLFNLQNAVDAWDVAGGLMKSVVFAITITLIACQRGLGTRGGASGVGAATTTAVVATLFALIVLDATFTVLFSVLGI